MKLIRSIGIALALLLFVVAVPKTYADDPCSPIANGPLLYQINRTPTQATLFFSPAGNDQIQSYTIFYGFKPGDDRYSLTVNQGTSTGAISYAINDLQPGVQYFYKVRGDTSCQSSPWSSWVGDKPVTKGSSIALPGIPVTGPNTLVTNIVISVIAIIAGLGLFVFSRRKLRYSL